MSALPRRVYSSSATRPLTVLPMTTYPRFLRLLFVGTAIAMAGACKAKPPAAAPAPATVRDTAAENAARRDAMQRENARMAAEAAAARQRFVDDSIANARAAEAAAQRERDMTRASLTTTIGFAFNKAELSADAKAALDGKIPILMANASLTLRIAGNADERGSTEYNLALGTARAAAAKRYLTERGIAAARIETTSFGEERPVCSDGTEECW